MKNNNKFPQTRYQGSKYKLSNWIQNIITNENLEFETVLDGFGGSGSVSYLFKKMNKTVTYNDALTFNSIIAKALIKNNNTILTNEDIKKIFTKRDNIKYPSFIFDTFKDIYYTDSENEELDMLIYNISLIEDEYKKAISLFALFQSCLIKRPYNLFHRKNLYIRTNEVKRSFGNKKSWDTPFKDHFIKFVNEANNAVFYNSKEHTVFNDDILNISGKYDLVYLDPPYISNKGVGVNYLDFYHFLEGLVDYYNWDNLITYDTKNKRLERKEHISIWTNKKEILNSFDLVFNKYKDSIIVLSYRSDGIPSIDEITLLLKKHKKEISIINSLSYKYALSNKKTQEILIIAK